VNYNGHVTSLGAISLAEDISHRKDYIKPISVAEFSLMTWPTHGKTLHNITIYHSDLADNQVHPVRPNIYDMGLLPINECQLS